MITEVKILLDNIKNFRHLISEGVGENDIVQYLNNHEFIYIYYGGDGVNKRGYRTIRPYVVGTNHSNNKVVRAWQDRGKSLSYQTKLRGNKHDYWTDEDGDVKPGWRMFRLDKIEKIYPTGKKFHKSDGTVMIPPDYKEGSDADMSSIIAWVSSKTEPETVKREVEPAVAGQKRTKWDNFSRGNKNNRKIEAGDVVKLRDIASRIYKKAIGNFIVVINNNNEFDIIEVKDKTKVPTEAIVGNLPNLYDTLVKKNAPVNDKFFKDKSNDAKREIEKTPNEIKETNLPSIPFEKKTFFKT
jgi:hypothetical protein